MADSFFVWDATKYSVQVAKMDNEHQALINVMNKLYDAHDSKAPQAEVMKCLGDLGAICVSHFKSEEEFFMALPNYDKKEVHKQIHVDLLNKFQAQVDKFKASGTLGPDFFTFLKMWLTAHISGVDMKYGEAANKKTA